MCIPKLTADLSYIQKLSDLPNATDGLSAAALKARFDQAAQDIQKWINEQLVPALTAQNLPFTASAQISARTVQDAVEAVQAQIRDVSSGTIASGSVTKEKLSAELLARIFGGLPWAAMEAPTEADNPDSGFPVGQIWLRPGFTVVNAAGTTWTGNGCTVTDGVLTGAMTAATALATQQLSGLGEEGDRVKIFFTVKDRNQEVETITISINGGQEQEAAAGEFDAQLLAGGVLTVRLTTTWSSAALAQAGWTMEQYTVVNLDAVCRQIGTAKETGDWAQYLNSLRPFTEHTVPDALYIQTMPGRWWQFLSAPEVQEGFSALEAGKPVWKSTEQTVQMLGAMRLAQGSYLGSGATGSIELPVAPAILVIAAAEGAPVTLCDGAKDGQNYTVSGNSTTYSIYSAVQLSGTTLHFTGGSSTVEGSVQHVNRKGETYRWTAVY